MSHLKWFDVDDIIMNIFRNKALECHVEVVDSYFTKQITTKFICTKGHFNTFTGKKAIMKFLMLYAHIAMLKKQNETIFVQYIKLGYS